VAVQDSRLSLRESGVCYRYFGEEKGNYLRRPTNKLTAYPQK
jgi:hypothetical protein